MFPNTFFLKFLFGKWHIHTGSQASRKLICRCDTSILVDRRCVSSSWCTCQIVVISYRNLRFWPKVGQIVPKKEKYGTFQLRFQYILDLIWQSPGFVRSGANMTHFLTKSDIPDHLVQGMDIRCGLQFSQIGTEPSQNEQKTDLKNLRFVPLGANLAQMTCLSKPPPTTHQGPYWWSVNSR